jgi:hypothetical protein
MDPSASSVSYGGCCEDRLTDSDGRLEQWMLPANVLRGGHRIGPRQQFLFEEQKMKLVHHFVVTTAGVLLASGAAIGQEQKAPSASPHTVDPSTATYGPSTYRGSEYGGAAYGDEAAGARNYGEWVRSRNPANCPPGLPCNVYKGS